MVCSGFEKSRETSGDEEELFDGAERRAFFLLVAIDYKQRSNYGQVAEPYFAYVLRICA